MAPSTNPNLGLTVRMLFRPPGFPSGQYLIAGSPIWSHAPIAIITELLGGDSFFTRVASIPEHWFIDHPLRQFLGPWLLNQNLPPGAHVDLRVDNKVAAWEWVRTHRWDEIITDLMLLCCSPSPAAFSSAVAAIRAHGGSASDDWVAGFATVMLHGEASRDAPAAQRLVEELFAESATEYLPSTDRVYLARYQVPASADAPLEMTSARAAIYKGAGIGPEEARRFERSVDGPPTLEVLAALAALTHPAGRSSA